ncbi:MAG: TfoX/Sxy family DNA transformation protein [Rhodobacteraceae bacterium]|nr:TfoX/Sxy family DNA transformation protein [Paracoccaceae bacterium]
MARPVSDIRNLGPASDAGFARAGIHSAEELIALGADEAYLRYLKAGGQAHFIGYYALVMGLQGRPWNDCRGAEKTALRARFDALKAAAGGTNEKNRSRMEAVLDEIGLLEPSRSAALQPSLHPTSSRPEKK